MKAVSVLCSRGRRRRGGAAVRHPLRHVRRLPHAQEGRGILRPRRAQAISRRQLILKGTQQRVLRLEETLPINIHTYC